MEITSAIDQYITIRACDYNALNEIIQSRLTQYGAYKHLRHKTIEEINTIDENSMRVIFRSLYSTQRQAIYNDLDSIIEVGGLKYFKGVINGILKSKHLNLTQFKHDQKDHIKYYMQLTGNRNLKFGIGTLSQIAHFCVPEKYPIHNTKSVKVINYLCAPVKVDDSYDSLLNEANSICNRMMFQMEEDYSLVLDTLFQQNKYVILDDFVEFIYEIIQT